jgi:hypothetical protein
MNLLPGKTHHSDIDRALANPHEWILSYDAPSESGNIHTKVAILNAIEISKLWYKVYNKDDNTSDRDALLDFIAIHWATLTKI